MQSEAELIPLPEVMRLVGLSRSEVWRRSASDPTFPKPTRLGTRATRWSRSEVLAYISERLAERNQAAA